MSDIRERIVAAAREWIGTPYVRRAMIKGVGCDCATLLFSVYRDVGLLAVDDVPVFSGDWWAHTTEESYMFRVIRHAKLMAETVAYRATFARPGDLVLVRVARSRVYNHGAIVVVWPRVIHAIHPVVQEIDASKNAMWTGREIAIFSPIPEDGARPVQMVQGTKPPPEKVEGLGDLAKTVFTALGFEHCKTCEEKKRRWNELLHWKRAAP